MDPFVRRLVQRMSDPKRPLSRNKHFHTFESPEGRAATVEVKPELAAFYADRLAQGLRERGLKVITWSEMGALLSQQRQLELLGCADDNSACMTELANALGTELTLMGSIAKLDQTL